MKGRLKGSKELYKLNKEDVINLITKYSYYQIGTMYNVSYSVVARIMAEKIEEYYIPKLCNMIQPYRLKSIPKEPFSYNENDYGSKKEIKNIITKDGLLEIKGNKDLDKIENCPTPLKLIIDTYKKVIKSN
jgi:hypothetical protein